MTTSRFDKACLPGRHVSVGPERAPRRSYYRAIGLTGETGDTPAELAERAGHLVRSLGKVKVDNPADGLSPEKLAAWVSWVVPNHSSPSTSRANGGWT